MKFTPKDGFPYYFELAKDGPLQDLYENFLSIEVLKSLSEEESNFRYEIDKWNIKQVLGHITDHERIKIFRAFQLSRNESIELWGYDQESLVKNSRFEELSLQFLLVDFLNIRKASISFIQSLSPSQLKRKGKARQHEITLEEFLRSIIGHEKHHVNIIQEKYFIK